MVDEEALRSIENLHRLKNEGIITEEEFQQSKQKLLFGQGPRRGEASGASMPGLNSFTGTLPAEHDYWGWMTLPIRRYADFTGRSTRREFWMFQLLSVGLIVVAAVLVSGSTDEYGDTSSLGMLMLVPVLLAMLGLALPLVAVQARRFHDQDRSGWLVLLNLIPYVGVIVVLVMMLLEGTRGDNKFGADPNAT